MTTPRWAAAHRSDLPRFERILCAVDMQQPTPGALGMAGLIAERFSASLEALYVRPASAGPALEQDLQRLAAGSSGLAAATSTLTTGDPARAIVERAASRNCDLIVLGSRQRSDLGWQFRDDVVRDVAAFAHCATLSVHERDTPAVIERILLPVDFGSATHTSTDWASAFALHFKAKVRLLHVVSRERSAARGTDRAELLALEQRMSACGVDVESQVVVAGSTANGIEGYNDQGEFDLVVMGLSGSSENPTRLTRGVIASLRNRMSVPLLSVRSTAFDATDPRARFAGLGRDIERAAGLGRSA